MTGLLREKSSFPEVVGFGNFVISFIKVIEFRSKNPILPIKNFWDFSQLFQSLSPANLLTGLFIKLQFLISFVYGVSENKRLISF